MLQVLKAYPKGQQTSTLDHPSQVALNVGTREYRPILYTTHYHYIVGFIIPYSLVTVYLRPKKSRTSRNTYLCIVCIYSFVCLFITYLFLSLHFKSGDLISLVRSISYYIVFMVVSNMFIHVFVSLHFSSSHFPRLCDVLNLSRFVILAKGVILLDLP